MKEQIKEHLGKLLTEPQLEHRKIREPNPLLIRLAVLFQQHQEDHPDTPITPTQRAEIVKTLGVTRQRVDQLSAKLQQQGEKIPHLWTGWRPDDISSFDSKCAALEGQGKTAQEIAIELSVPQIAVRESHRRRSAEEKKQKTQEEIENVRALRRQGLGNKEIGERLQLSRGKVINQLKKLIQTDETLRLRKKRRTKQEMKILSLQIKKLYNKGLTNRQITDVFGKEVSLQTVINVVNNLIQTGEIPRKIPKILTSTPSYTAT